MLFRHPLLSSQGVVRGYFENAVIVCEGEGDRTIYRAVAEVLHARWDSHIVSVGGKQNVAKVVTALREAKVPVRVIVDFDLIHGAAIVKNLLVAIGAGEDIVGRCIELQEEVLAGVSIDAADTLMQRADVKLVNILRGIRDNSIEGDSLRRELESLAEELKPTSDLKKKGLYGASSAIIPALCELLCLMWSVGIYIVPVGKLESWFPSISQNRYRGSEWVEKAMGVLYENESPAELRSFIENILDSVTGAVYWTHIPDVPIRRNMHTASQ